jgi:O-antigen/teichoic acid export membrane protein
VISIGAVVATVVLLSEHIATLLGESRLAPFLVLGGGYVVGKTLLTFCSITFQGFNRTDWSALVKTVSSVGLLGFVLFFLYLGFETIGAFAGYVTGSVVAVVIGGYVLYTRFYTQYDPDPEMEAGLSRRILRYSVPLTVTRTAHSLDRQVDTVLVGYFLTTTAVGYYTLAKQIADFVITPASSLGFAISPAYGEWKASDNIDEAARIYETSLVYVLLWYLPAAVGLILLADPVVVLIFGERYADATPVVAVFGVYILLRAIDKITNDGLDYLGQARARAIAKSGASIGNFALNLVMIPAIGVVGAAIATVITQGLLVAFELYIVHQHLDLDVWRLLRDVGGICLVTGGMTVSIYWFVPYISGLVSLFALIGFAVLVWAALAIGSGFIEPSQVRTFLQQTDE